MEQMEQAFIIIHLQDIMRGTRMEQMEHFVEYLCFKVSNHYLLTFYGIILLSLKVSHSIWNDCLD